MTSCRTNTKKGPYTCRYCKLSYEKLNHASEHYCTRFLTYRKEDIPKDLFSLSELRALKLKPKDKNKGDALYIYWTKESGEWARNVAFLWFKKNTKPPKKMSAKQIKAVEKLKRLNKTISKSYSKGGFKSISEIKEINLFNYKYANNYTILNNPDPINIVLTNNILTIQNTTPSTYDLQVEMDDYVFILRIKQN